jgi:CubicO group peptidase (beta-lactamase class C family)
MPITNTALSNANKLKLRIDRLEYLDRMLEKWVSDDTRPTIVTKVMRYGDLIFEGVYGTSFTDTKLDYDTIFPVMSLTKPVTSILLHILQEDGLVDLVDPVRHYLPDFIHGGRDKICLWHLLTHTSGLPEGEQLDEFVKDYIKDKLGIDYVEKSVSSDEWHAAMKKAHEKLGLEKCDDDEIPYMVYDHITEFAPLNNEPRKVMSYLNLGFDIAKRVIDEITGEPIDEFAKRVLFDPLGMTDTHWKLPKEKWHRVVGRSERVLGYPWACSERMYLAEDGSGTLKSTVNDYIKLMEMMRCYGQLGDVRVLSPASVKSMIRNHNTDSFSEYDSWGLGWSVKGNKKDDNGTLCSPNTIDHGGWAGTKVLTDYDNGISYAFFSLVYKYDESRPEDLFIYRPRFTNALMSALL